MKGTKKQEISYVNVGNSSFTIILKHLSDFRSRYAEITSYARKCMRKHISL
jgi:hypothetical protein